MHSSYLTLFSHYFIISYTDIHFWLLLRFFKSSSCLSWAWVPRTRAHYRVPNWSWLVLGAFITLKFLKRRKEIRQMHKQLLLLPPISPLLREILLFSPAFIDCMELFVVLVPFVSQEILCLSLRDIAEVTLKNLLVNYLWDD